MFSNITQVDVVTVLMLLGEATIWKAIWSRQRSRCMHWTHFIHSISPGWAPLAASLFAELNGSDGPPNLIFDRPPQASVESNLFLTNLNSGATHSAQNIILQNIWQTWSRGSRRTTGGSSQSGEPFDLTREIGVVEVDLDALNLESPTPLRLHIAFLLVQFGGSVVIACLGLSLETFTVLTLALIGQLLLLISITPHEKAWYKAVRKHRPSPIMLHKGRDSMGTLIVRKARQKGMSISLEEFCWESQASKSRLDIIKLAAAGVSFLLFVFQIILVGWMASESRAYYLIFGFLGLVANTIEAVLQPKWSKAFAFSFSGKPRCAPAKSSLMSSVAMLIAGQFPAAIETAKLLYPPNARFGKTLQDLSATFDEIICQQCRHAIRRELDPGQFHHCLRIDSPTAPNECSALLAARAREVDSKQLSDGLAAVCHFLCSLNGSTSQHTIETSYKIVTAMKHVW